MYRKDDLNLDNLMRGIYSRICNMYDYKEVTLFLHELAAVGVVTAGLISCLLQKFSLCLDFSFGGSIRILSKFFMTAVFALEVFTLVLVGSPFAVAEVRTLFFANHILFTGESSISITLRVPGLIIYRVTAVELEFLLSYDLFDVTTVEVTALFISIMHVLLMINATLTGIIIAPVISRLALKNRGEFHSVGCLRIFSTSTGVATLFISRHASITGNAINVITQFKFIHLLVTNLDVEVITLLMSEFSVEASVAAVGVAARLSCMALYDLLFQSLCCKHSYAYTYEVTFRRVSCFLTVILYQLFCGKHSNDHSFEMNCLNHSSLSYFHKYSYALSHLDCWLNLDLLFTLNHQFQLIIIYW